MAFMENLKAVEHPDGKITINYGSYVQVDLSAIVADVFDKVFKRPMERPTNVVSLEDARESTNGNGKA